MTWYKYLKTLGVIKNKINESIKNIEQLFDRMN